MYRLFRRLLTHFARPRNRHCVQTQAAWLPAFFGGVLAASCTDSGHVVATGSGPEASTPPDGSSDLDAGDSSSEAQTCPTLTGGPPGIAPLPSAAEVVYQRRELLGFAHLGLETFDGTEHGGSADSPSLFNPTSLDASQWVTAFKNAGVRQVTLVAKHETGFCLWPSAFTDYSVKSSPWKGGQGDVVREFTDAMHAAGMAVGFALSPLDNHYPSSSSTYETYYRNLLTELLTNYGPVAELFLAGFEAPTSLNWSGIAALAHQLQPSVVIMMGPEIAATGADIRYIGNQTGQGNRSLSSV